MMDTPASSRRSFFGKGLAVGASAFCPAVFAMPCQAGEPRRPVPDDVEPAFPSEPHPREIRTKLRELLGVELMPETIPVKHEEAEKTADGLVQTRLSFANVLGDVVTAILLQPAGAKRRSHPGVVCMSGTSGSAERITRAEFRRAKPDEGSLLGWARELARRGFVTLSLTLKGTVGRRVSVSFWEKQARMLAPFGRTLMGVMVDEALRGARILGETDVVDPQRLALTGMSLGGNVTWYAMACEPDIRAAVPVCGGVGSLRRQILEGDPNRHSTYFYVPHLLRYFDHPQIVATCICPRPFMAIAPTRDEDMPKSGVDEFVRVVQPAYKEAGHPERFRVYQPESQHSYTQQYFEEMAKWLSRHC
jgi:dienelactone hydrolase